MQEQNSPLLNRRKFVASLGLIGAATGLRPASVFSERLPVAMPAVDNIKCKPYLQALLTDNVTIRWITAHPSHCWVEYGETQQALNSKAQHIEEGMIQVDNTIHAISLTNLLPGRTYFYRTASRKVESMERGKHAFGEPVFSEMHSFTTPSPDDDSVEFIVFNDIHDRPESFGHLMKYSTPGKKDFVFLNGDMFNRQDDENQIIQHLIDPLTSLFASTTPFLLGRGNHETWGAYARDLSKYFDGRENKYYYSFQFGPMYGLVMDSGDTKPDEDRVNGGVVDFDAYRDKQAQWLAKEVQKPAFKKSKYKVVFIHIPAYYLGSAAHASEQYNKTWGPIFNAAKINLMFCGHTHTHGIHKPVQGEHNYPIVIGGGPKDGKRTIINVKVTNKQLNLTMTADTGEVVGVLNI